MSKVDCKDCQFYHNGRCEELGEYTTPGECECSWFARRVNKKRCVAEIAKMQNNRICVAKVKKKAGERMSNTEVHLTREEIEHPYANLAVMLEDKRKKAEQMHRTVFARITSSPEVLAEKLVYPIYDTDSYEWWTSTLCNYTPWKLKSEAIAATVAKLKEVVE